MSTLEIKQKLSNKNNDRKKRYKLRKLDLSTVIITFIILTFVGTLIYFLGFLVEYKPEMFRPDLFIKIGSEFFRFDKVLTKDIIDIIFRILNTIVLGFMTTVIGAIVGLFFGLLAARNLSKPAISNFIRAIAGFIRAVPTIIWVLIFVPSYGLTATTAIVGMTFHSVAFFIKSYSESFEEVDEGAIEALRATGASWAQIITNAVLPSAFTKIISWIAIRSEINFSVAVVIGPAVGVPGMVGTIISACSRTGNYAQMGVAVLCLFITSLLFEMVITKFKQKAIVN